MLQIGENHTLEQIMIVIRVHSRTVNKYKININILISVAKALFSVLQYFLIRAKIEEINI